MNRALQFRRRLWAAAAGVTVILGLTFCLVERSADVRTHAPWTVVILLIAGFLTIGTLVTADNLIQKEILLRARVECGLRVAQEMLGTKLEGQCADLDDMMKDLHVQIRARQKTEEAVRELNEDLGRRVRQQAAELDEMNHELELFSYSVSHDLRAPLRHLFGFSRILQQEYGPHMPNDAQHCVERICGAASHMSELVEDFVRLAQVSRQPARRELQSLRALVDKARISVKQECNGRKISWQIYSLPEADVDAELLGQVFTNLFSNAVKFTRQRRLATIEVGSFEDDGMIVVFVRDNGAGFDPRYADKLFGVFQRLHAQGEFEGTGVGLATVQRIIRKHGGRVWAESRPQEGASFYFSLPISTHRASELRQIIGAVG